MSSFPVTEQNRIRRHAERAHYDRATIYAILDATFVAQVAYVRDRHPVIIPTLYARRGDTLLFHGAPTCGLMEHLAQGGEVAVSVTLLDGIVVTKALYDLSVNYRSVVAFGHGRLLKDPEAKRAALRHLTEHIVPGHWQEVNAPRPEHLAHVAVAEVPIESASAKIRDLPPHEEGPSRDLPVWAGYLPARLIFGPPHPAEYAAGIPLPESLRRHFDLEP